MKLKIFLPTEIYMDREIQKIKAESVNGNFCLLPKHIDFSAVLVPGIISIETQTGQEEFLAVNEGFLIKCAQNVFLSTRNVVAGKPLGELHQLIENEFEKLNEQERKMRSILSKLEADFARRFLSWTAD